MGKRRRPDMVLKLEALKARNSLKEIQAERDALKAQMEAKLKEKTQALTDEVMRLSKEVDALSEFNVKETVANVLLAAASHRKAFDASSLATKVLQTELSKQTEQLASEQSKIQDLSIQVAELKKLLEAREGEMQRQAGIIATMRQEGIPPIWAHKLYRDLNTAQGLPQQQVAQKLFQRVTKWLGEGGDPVIQQD